MINDKIHIMAHRAAAALVQRRASLKREGTEFKAAVVMNFGIVTVSIPWTDLDVLTEHELVQIFDKAMRESGFDKPREN